MVRVFVPTVRYRNDVFTGLEIYKSLIACRQLALERQRMTNATNDSKTVHDYRIKTMRVNYP